MSKVFTSPHNYCSLRHCLPTVCRALSSFNSDKENKLSLNYIQIHTCWYMHTYVQFVKRIYIYRQNTRANTRVCIRAIFARQNLYGRLARGSPVIYCDFTAARVIWNRIPCTIREHFFLLMRPTIHLNSRENDELAIYVYCIQPEFAQTDLWNRAILHCDIIHHLHNAQITS